MSLEFFYDAILAFYVALLGLAKGIDWNWTQVFGSGIIAGIGLFFANLLLDKYRRPQLKVKSQAAPVVIDLAVYNVSDPALRPEQWPARKMTVKYKVSRLKIENDGRLAAEDSKGILNDGADTDKLQNELKKQIDRSRSLQDTVKGIQRQLVRIDKTLYSVKKEHEVIRKNMPNLILFKKELTA